MTKDDLKNKKIPDNPGVYFFLGSRSEILYIGKATSLRSRVKSYFSVDIKEKRSPLIEKMVHESQRVEWTVTDSVLEALLLETNLIRTHKPRFNTRAKDDKSFNHIVITDETFPRVLVVRGKDLSSKFIKDTTRYTFGPFPSGALFKSALRIIRRIFQFYDTEQPVNEYTSKLKRGQIDFNRQIGLYPGTQDKKEYLRTIRHIRMFFEGKKKLLIKELEREMSAYAKKQEFEKADLMKRRIFALKHIQDVALIKDDLRTYRDDRTLRIEAYDIAHLGGNDMVGAMIVVEHGEPKKSAYRKFKIKSITRSNDTGALREILDRRLGHDEWPLPHLIVVDGSTAQKNAAESILRKYGVVIPVLGVVKDEHHKPKNIIGAQKHIREHEREILLANAEAHRFALAFHRKKRNATQ